MFVCSFYALSAEIHTTYKKFNHRTGSNVDDEILNQAVPIVSKEVPRPDQTLPLSSAEFKMFTINHGRLVLDCFHYRLWAQPALVRDFLSLGFISLVFGDSTPHYEAASGITPVFSFPHPLVDLFLNHKVVV